jgi:endonuclease/exonuclease/phosphatase family metal-dependent hydrolase
MNVFRAVVLSFLFAPLFTPAQTNDLIDLEFGTPQTFDVATWNIEWFPKNGEITIDYVAQIVEELQLDVIAIQEIDSDEEFQNLLNLLEDYDGVFQPGDIESLGYIYQTQYVAINDVYSIYSSSSFSNPFPRAPMILECTFADGTDFVLINNHFKCCGNGILEPDDFWDEETRRAYASELLKDFMDDNFSDRNLIMLGDLNDRLIDPPIHNVFQVFFDDPDHYLFADMNIAEGPASQWSYPSWPSHLDHILISDELFPALDNPDSEVVTIQIDDYFPGGLEAYDTHVSDHLPVAFQFQPSAILSTEASAAAFDLTLYPNPTSGVVHLSGVPSVQHVRVFDSGGRLLETVTPISNTLDFSHLPNGVYSVSLITSGGNKLHQRLVLYRR